MSTARVLDLYFQGNGENFKPETKRFYSFEGTDYNSTGRTPATVNYVQVHIPSSNQNVTFASSPQ